MASASREPEWSGGCPEVPRAVLGRRRTPTPGVENVTGHQECHGGGEGPPSPSHEWDTRSAMGAGRSSQPFP